ncbi:MAG: hypothetical protein KBG21_06625 [Ignavibacteria bacterium]|nr:hypothetical protein [Ignavibacteria bacterium]
MKKFLTLLLFIFILIPSIVKSQYTDYFKYQKPLLQIISNIALDSVIKVDMRKVRMNKIAGVTVTDQDGKKVEYWVYDTKGNIATYYQFEDTAKFTYDKLGKIVYTVLDSFPKNIYENIIFKYTNEGNLELIDKNYNDVQPEVRMDYIYENKYLKTITAIKEDSDFRKQYGFFYEGVNNMVKTLTVANLGVDEIGATKFIMDFNNMGKLAAVNFSDKNMAFVNIRYNGDTVHISPNENVFDPVNGISPLDQVFYTIKNQRIMSKTSLLKFSTYNVMRIADYVYTNEGVIDYINVKYVSFRGVIKTEKLNFTYELYQQN